MRLSVPASLQLVYHLGTLIRMHPVRSKEIRANLIRFAHTQ